MLPGVAKATIDLLRAIEASPGLLPSDLQEQLGLPKKLVTKHLAILRRHDFVCSHRTLKDGRERRYYGKNACPAHAVPGRAASRPAGLQA